MTSKEWLLIPLFDQFIKDSYKGKRLKADGSKIKPQTIANHEYVLRYLKEYETKNGSQIRIKIFKGTNQRLFASEKNYWRKFYEGFTNYLYKDKGCFDNYVGTVIKTIRIFFNWLNKDRGIATGDFHRNFYVCKEEVPIVTLMPEQLDFLINDSVFNNSLSKTLLKSKSIFIFGCTVALRVSDLFSLQFTDVSQTGSSYYLKVKTMKTGSIVRFKLPLYAVQIIEQFKQTARRRKTIFPPIPPSRFNNHVKEIAALAGWTEPIGKSRTKKGVDIECKRKQQENTTGNNVAIYRFCDLVSSHTMRRTAITTMLMLGMKEHVVKQLSGHAGNSKSFYRYVNLVQPYVDNEYDKVWSRFEPSASS
ncbi:MAG: tyrosine-type recombinase/integrase [Ferruginibacter sp.]